ncbi:MAG: ABC transporter substrate-binding protein [Prevotella sp.]|nr:ABC transporter substrate-binding protein [Prevotella sp.]
MKGLTVRQKRILAVSACVLLAFAVAGIVYVVHDDENINEIAKTDGGMTVAVTPTLDCLPLYVAQANGIAEDMGCTLVLQEHMSIADCDSALTGGSAVCATTDCVRAEMFLADKKKTSGKQFLLLQNPNLWLYLFANRKARIRKVSQMKDKMIAVDRKGADALMAQYVLDSVKLADDKAFLVNINSISTRMAMLANNTMDAAVLPEPIATVARKAGHEGLYAEHGRDSKVYGAFLVKDGMKDMFVKVYNRACDSINKNGVHHYDSILIRRMAVPGKYVKDIPARRFVKL